MRLRENLSCIITLSDRAELRAFEYRTHKLQLLLRRLRFTAAVTLSLASFDHGLHMQ